MRWTQKCILIAAFAAGCVICQWLRADDVPPEHREAWGVVNAMRTEKKLPPLAYSQEISSDCQLTAELQKKRYGGGLCHLCSFENLAANRGDYNVEEWSDYVTVTNTYRDKRGRSYTKKVEVPSPSACKITKVISGIVHAVDSQWRYSGGHYANIMRSSATVGGIGFYKDENGHVWVCFRTAVSIEEYSGGQERRM